MNCHKLRVNWSGTEERVVPVPPVGGSASFSRKTCNASNGTAIEAMRNELTRRAGIVSEKTLKKASLTRDKKASGTTIMIVVWN